MIHMVTSKTPNVPNPTANNTLVEMLSLMHRNFMLTHDVDSGSSRHYKSTVSHVKILETTALWFHLTGRPI